MELLDRFDYERITVEDIARQAHVSKTSIYEKKKDGPVYQSKRGILSAIVVAFAESFSNHVSAFSLRHHDAEFEAVCANVGRGGAGGEVVHRCYSRRFSTTAPATPRWRGSRLPRATRSGGDATARRLTRFTVPSRTVSAPRAARRCGSSRS
ncbi:MAG: TetR family transcriptional regulator [Chloroflexi bacterium]|nr:TetR family transcriptional regulator [Chloroflexota bacterium]